MLYVLTGIWQLSEICRVITPEYAKPTIKIPEEMTGSTD